MPSLTPSERQRFIKAVKKLPTKLFPDIFTPSLEHYDKIVTKAEKAISKRRLKLNKPWSVISVHSHKGGVGKTTMAIALAAELAKAKKRVCLVDCDDEGPSLYQSFQIADKKHINVLFLIDWFRANANHIPSGLIQRISIIQNKQKKLSLSCIPSSFIDIDIGLLDELQHGERVRDGNYTSVQNLLEKLIQILIKEKKFDCVVIDNGPGLAHFALDVLMATLGVGGSNVFVLRPRVTDICQLCIDYDWLWFLRKKEEQLGRNAVVFNAVSTTMEGDRTIDLTNGQEIADQLEEWPQFDVYTDRYFSYYSARSRLSEHIKEIIDLLKNNIIEIPAIDVLRHADEFYKPSKSHAEIIIAEIGGEAKSILSNFGFKG
ncbi:MAG: AAA family ATPase [Desulfobacterales bacterium]|nr:AAA family ATPase [Desulfobacterales bacterium]